MSLRFTEVLSLHYMPCRLFYKMSALISGAYVDSLNLWAMPDRAAAGKIVNFFLLKNILSVQIESRNIPSELKLIEWRALYILGAEWDVSQKWRDLVNIAWYGRWFVTGNLKYESFRVKYKETVNINAGNSHDLQFSIKLTIRPD